MIQNASHGSLISKEIVHIKLGLAKKIMHDLKGFVPGLFTPSHLKNSYIHENEPDDIIF